ncbi:M4 family metallopeptidase [Actinoplanes sp. NPDC049548]|uniref:M4 family metallopeptidase n=1 Tax=Actinoplanes sp. NPDC049548 TaxID=3155152 RepID=UPI0034491890
MKRSIAAVGSALLLGGLLAGVDGAAAVAAPDPLSPSAHRAAVKASAADAFAVLATAKDADGTTHVRYGRTYEGLRVLGGDFILHGAKDGALRSASVGLAAPLALSTTPQRSAASAAAAAKAQFAGKVSLLSKPELVVDATAGSGTLAYETVIEGFGADGQTPSRLHVVTDATSGKVLSSWDTVETAAGSGRSLYSGTVTIDTTQTSSGYSLKDAAHGNGTTCDMNNRTSGTCSVFADTDNVWGTGSTGNRQSAAVDAHYGAAKTYDYYNSTFGRRGIFNNGTGVPSRVHYGNAYVNAFWDGAQMTYGDGSGNARPLVSLDVAAHEMSHGVTERTAGLTYSGESGGLNEATSDIFATMVEFSAGNSADAGDYQIGEKININGNNTPLRYMYNPSLDGRGSQNCWSTSTKNVDVHFSSGVGNHFFFNLAEGTGATAYGTSPVCNSAPAVTGIGRSKAAAIWYRALTTYFTSSTTYAKARSYTLSAATDLYGRCGTEYKAVQKAWTAVNVAGTDAAC